MLQHPGFWTSYRTTFRRLICTIMTQLSDGTPQYRWELCFVASQLLPTNCSAVKQLPQFCKHSKSADSQMIATFSCLAGPKFKALSCKHERLLTFDPGIIISCNKIAGISCKYPLKFSLKINYQKHCENIQLMYNGIYIIVRKLQI